VRSDGGMRATLKAISARPLGPRFDGACPNSPAAAHSNPAKNAGGLAPLHYVRNDCGARRLRVSDLHALGMKVGWDPDNGHEHHGAIWNMPKAQSSRRKISRMAILLKKADGEN
jgi:hypothetical protein